MKPGDKSRVQVRRSIYRGNAGFTIVGRKWSGGKICVFTRTQAGAELIRAAYKACDEAQLEAAFDVAFAADGDLA